MRLLNSSQRRRLAEFVLGGGPAAAEKRERIIQKMARELPAHRKRGSVHEIIASMTERDAIETLQSVRLSKRLDYAKTDVLLHAETHSAYLRHRAARKEPWTIAWIETCMGAGEVLYDVGANTGVYSLLSLRLHQPDFRVVAFEPIFANFTDLCRNLILNECMDRAVALPVALTAKSGLLRFNLRNIEAGGAMHSVSGEAGKPGESAAQTVSVMGRPLDAVIEELSLPPADHIKIDVDGGELDVLMGAARALMSPTLKTVLMEVETEPQVLDGVAAMLDKAGLIRVGEFHRKYEDGRIERSCYQLYARHPDAIPAAIVDRFAANGPAVGR
jgi:FkbM family methyltransferase